MKRSHKHRYSVMGIVAILALVFAACSADKQAREGETSLTTEGEEGSAKMTVDEDGAKMTVSQDVESDGDISLAQWKTDTDGDGIPDFIGTELVGPNGEKSCLVGSCDKAKRLGMIHMPRQVNTLIVFDSSGSMADDLKKGTKLDVARDAVRRYLQSIPHNAIFRTGVMAFGHEGDNTVAGKEESCNAVETMVPVGKATAKRSSNALDDLQPTGWTPLASAVKKANEVLPEGPYMNNRIILVTDGLERCGGEPVKTVRKLTNQGNIDRVDVIGFKLADDIDRSSLKEMAKISGGEYHAAEAATDLDAAFGDLVEVATITQEVYLCGLRNAPALTACYRRLTQDAVDRIDTELSVAQEHGEDEKVTTINYVKKNIVEGGASVVDAIENYQEMVDELQVELEERENVFIDEG